MASTMNNNGEVSSPCYKKDPEVGFLANAKDHLEQFVNTSADQHWICLKKNMKEIQEFINRKRQEKLKSGGDGNSVAKGASETSASVKAH